MNTPMLATQSPSVWKPILYGALAGGMAWGIRGQYGHETGAMMAGLLVGLVMVLLFRPNASSLAAARAVAWCTVAIGFGGCETYGQTVGLTHNPAVIGNWAALGWGLLGLALKGGLWIGFAGLFLGMGLSGLRYTAREMLVLMAGLFAVFFVGVWICNTPFDPAHHVLPKVYFSADWRWEANNLALKPRREVWGGLLFALLVLASYVRWVRRDLLAGRLTVWATLGGAIGFPLGQCIQAVHAWNRVYFQQVAWAGFASHINWWNMMETTFGAVAGAAIGLGLWLNRSRIASLDSPAPVTIRPAAEWLLIGAHTFLLMTSEFELLVQTRHYTEYSLLMGLIPIIGIAGGRWWPYLIALPITLLPIAAKTLRQLVYEERALTPVLGWIIYLIIPTALATWVAMWCARQWKESAAMFLQRNLIAAAWLIFGLNYAFFHYPWPWVKWTMRTPNGVIYTICLLALTYLAFRACRKRVTLITTESLR